MVVFPDAAAFLQTNLGEESAMGYTAFISEGFQDDLSCSFSHFLFNGFLHSCCFFDHGYFSYA
jgi:hypothetical protein